MTLNVSLSIDKINIVKKVFNGKARDDERKEGGWVKFLKNV